MDQDSQVTDARSDPQHGVRLEPTARTPRTGLHAPPLHILLAHPHCMFSQGLAAYLAAQHDVELLARVTDGQSAWKVIRTRRPHIALLDQRLDKLSETEIAQRVQAKGLATRCYLFGTATGAGAAAVPWSADAPGRLSKDSGFEELMDILRGAAAIETVASPSAPTAAPAAAAKGPGAVPLTPRERDVLRLIVAGDTNKKIARALGVSPNTVHTHRRRLMRKLGVHSTAELVCYAARNGLLD